MLDGAVSDIAKVIKIATNTYVALCFESIRQ